jgi:hypothetical protein
LDSIEPELLNRLPYPYYAWREAGGKNERGLSDRRGIEVKKIHDPKDETDVLGVKRDRRSTQYLKCSHPSLIRGFRRLEGG